MIPYVGTYQETHSAKALIARALNEAGRFPLSVLQLMFRVAVGAVFFKSGLTKIASWELTLQLFQEEYAVPLLPVPLAAMLATAAELTAPVLLVIGLATRLAALPLLAMTMVIQLFVYPENWAEHLMWAGLLLFLITRGPGTLSLDHIVRRTLLDGKM
jgi:putative oxidoreductase